MGASERSLRIGSRCWDNYELGGWDVGSFIVVVCMLACGICAPNSPIQHQRWPIGLPETYIPVLLPFSSCAWDINISHFEASVRGLGALNSRGSCKRHLYCTSANKDREVLQLELPIQPQKQPDFSCLIAKILEKESNEWKVNDKTVRRNWWTRYPTHPLVSSRKLLIQLQDPSGNN